jgi:glucose dehydrogenase
MRPTTGEVVWYYQFTPNDAYDYDACWELINADIDVGSQKRKVIMQLNRNGFLYVIDRTNGKLLAANAFEKVNWASHVDKETGRDRHRQEHPRGQGAPADSPGTCRLLSRRRPAANLALHVLRRSGASLCRLSHGSGRRMLQLTFN